MEAEVFQLKAGNEDVYICGHLLRRNTRARARLVFNLDSIGICPLMAVNQKRPAGDWNDVNLKVHLRLASAISAMPRSKFDWARPAARRWFLTC